jgi:dipeptidase E
MRLYLSSFRLGNQPAKFVALVKENKKVALIINACDHKEGREARLEGEITDLKSIGLLPEEIDLRNYFGKSNELREKMKEYGATWIRGGNVFILKRAYEQSGFDVIITDMVVKDEIVYAGYSAGVCIAAPDLHGTEIVDDPNIVPEGYQPEFSWNGLGFLSYATSVHYKSDHPESIDVEKEVAYFQAHSIPFKTLRDGEAILIHGTKEEILH